MVEAALPPSDGIEPSPSGTPTGGVALKIALLIAFAAAIVGSVLAVMLSDDAAVVTEESSTSSSEAPGGPDDDDGDGGAAAATPPPSTCENDLIEGVGAEFATRLGAVRICGATRGDEVPGFGDVPNFEAQVPPGRDIIVIRFEPAAGGDAGAFSELFLPDAPGGEPTLTHVEGEPAVFELGGLLSGELLIAYTVTEGATGEFLWQYPGSEPIVLVLP